MRTASLIVVASLLVGCGGGAAGSALPAAPSANSSQPHGVSILIPAKRTTTQARVRPAYVSPSTQSAVVHIMNSPGGIHCTPANASCTDIIPPITANLTPSSPNCAPVSGGTQCTIMFGALPPQTIISVAVELFSGLNGTGSLLSSSVISGQIYSRVGSANLISLALGGVPARMTFAQAAPIKLDGSTPTVTYTATYYDAAGNQIIGSDRFAGPDYTQGQVVVGFSSIHGCGQNGGTVYSPLGNTTTTNNTPFALFTPADYIVVNNATACAGNDYAAISVRYQTTSSTTTGLFDPVVFGGLSPSVTSATLPTSTSSQTISFTSYDAGLTGEAPSGCSGWSLPPAIFAVTPFTTPQTVAANGATGNCDAYVQDPNFFVATNPWDRSTYPSVNPTTINLWFPVPMAVAPAAFDENSLSTWSLSYASATSPAKALTYTLAAPGTVSASMAMCASNTMTMTLDGTANHTNQSVSVASVAASGSTVTVTPSSPGFCLMSISPALIAGFGGVYVPVQVAW